MNQIYTHARLFVMPSYHEGLLIALLEALSYELPVLVSDIPANMEIALDEKRFFACGDVEDLLSKITSLLPYGLPLQGPIDTGVCWKRNITGMLSPNRQ